MADSHVLARKFRPQTFDEVIGQDAITRTLSNAVKNDRVHHAYIFTGARGVGKTTTARIFAKALNCAKGVTPEPCGVCHSCQDIVASRSMDVLEIDAASNTGVDNVRDVIINSISIAPARDRYKIFIIDEVHMLSAQAFNALLKTVEEPPPRVVFILATTNLEKVPETILSRCQIFEFRTITLKQIVGQLSSIAEKEGVGISEAALLAIARAGEGSMRDAESALDQVISFAVGATITDDDVSAALGMVDTETLNKTLQAIADQQSGELVRIVDDVVSRGYDLRNFCREMMVHIRALLVVKIAGFDSEIVQLPESEADNLKRIGEHFSEQDLLRFFVILTKTEQDIRNSSQPRFQLEIGLVKLAQARRLFLLEETISRIEALESRLGGSGATSSPLSARGANTQSRPTQDSSRTPAATRATTGPAVRAHQGAATPDKPVVRGEVPVPVVEPSAPPAKTGVAAKATPARSSANFEGPPTSEPPPPPMDEYYGLAPLPSPKREARSESEGATAERSPADKIKSALEAKRKMMIVTALDKGTISIDGDFLGVEYPAEHGACKAEIEARDKRNAIEDACEQVLGRRLTLRASIAGQASDAVSAGNPRINTASDSDPGAKPGIGAASGSAPRGKTGISAASGNAPRGKPEISAASGSERGPQRKAKPKDAAEEDPKLQALLDKFHGEVIEVIKPEQ